MLSLILACATTSFAQLSLSEGPDTSAGNLACYIIKSPVATYYFEKLGAGLSSMIDTKGNDWLSFKPDAGSKEAGEFRGFPNAVSGFFTPKMRGPAPARLRWSPIPPNTLPYAPSPPRICG
jgi:hypothetical protein